MKILHVANGRLYGGIERMLTTLAASQPPRGDLVSAFALCHDGRLLDDLRTVGAEVHPLGNVRLSRPATVLSARKQLRALIARGGYDAVLCHAPWSHALFGGVVRHPGTRLVLWQHDRATGRPLLERAARTVRADLVICNSEWTSRSAERVQPGVPRRVVYCPVAPPRATASRKDTRRALGASGADVVILSASRLEPWKGHVELLHALAEVADLRWQLWIAGGAQRRHEAAYAAHIIASAQVLGLEGRIRMLGERRDVADLLAASDLLAQANVEPEPFGIVFAEALLSGIPVLTTDMGGAPEIVGRSCGVLVPPGDDQTLVRALRELLSDPLVRASLGAAGPAHAAARCAPAIALEELTRALLSAGVAHAA